MASFMYFRFMGNGDFQLFCMVLYHPFPQCKCTQVRAVCGPLVKEKHRRKPHNITIECKPAPCGELLHVLPIVCSLPLCLKICVAVKGLWLKHLFSWWRVSEVVLE